MKDSVLHLIATQYSKFFIQYMFIGASQMVLVVKNPPANAADMGSIPGLGSSPRGGHGNPLQDSCLENLHGQRTLVGYSP